MNRISLLLFAAALAFPLGVQAQSFTTIDGSTSEGPAVELDHGPLTYRGGGTPVTLTHSASQDIVPLTGVACPTPPNSYFRVFELPDFDIGGTLEVSSVDIGIEEVQTPHTTTVNLYTLNGPFVMANLTLVSTTTLDISAANNLSLVNVSITGSFESTETLVVEWAVPQVPVFFGGNHAGQTDPTYVMAAGCGAAEPTDIATLGNFPTNGWLVNVHGDDIDTSSNEAGSELPTSVTLGEGYPNPFNPSATVPFTVSEATEVRLAVYDALGREVAVLATGRYTPGTYTATFDAEGLPSGTYMTRLEANGQVQSRSLTLLK